MSLYITEEDFFHAVELTNRYAPAKLPMKWHEVNVPIAGQRAYKKENGLAVIFTADDMHGDGRTWLHVSMSRATRLPSYEDIVEVKRLFVGDDLQALQIFPKIDRHINIHPFCLHLWAAVEGDGLPDFGREGTI